MKILVLNCGSSSIKYQFIDVNKRYALAKGAVSRIGMSAAVLVHKPHDRPEVTISGEMLDHIMAVEHVIAMLLSPNHGVIGDRSEIDAVGHRVVHGGEKFPDSVLIDRDVMQVLRSCIELAPLHNPHNIRGIRACEQILPGVPQVAVFDTAFHHKMPACAYVYGLPYVLYKRHGIRRYGFHGISHFYVSRLAAEMMNRPIEELNLITCHLGNGASVAAIRGGVSVDTSMGFTPLEGLLMGSRSGDIDPAIILHVMAREELSLHEANTLLNKHSGLQGISGISGDMRDIIDEVENGNSAAQLALDVYCYRVRKYIGAYAAALGGFDGLVFTAGIGENSPLVREKSCTGLEFLGIKIDPQTNDQATGRQAREIQTEYSKVKVFCIPTNEELVIATDTKRVIQEAKEKQKMHKGV
jgi:acetate kinase